LSYIREGTLRILTYLSSYKVSGYEGIPSTVELYGFEASSLLCVAAPKGIPEYAVKKLEDAFAKAAKEPVFTQMMARMNMPIDYKNRVDLTKYTQEYFSKMAKVYEQIRAEESKKK
jgi:tripartite-type tricarboxylate transporter receptor subunit TctC